jgi:hypothetical protein
MTANLGFKMSIYYIILVTLYVVTTGSKLEQLNINYCVATTGLPQKAVDRGFKGPPENIIENGQIPCIAAKKRII